MRPKIVITVLIVGLAGLAVIFWLKPAAKQPETVPNPPSVAIAPVTNLSAAAVIPVISSNNAPAIAQRKPVNPFITPRATGLDAEFLQKKMDRLEELQANDDDASLQEILAELTNTNRLIRHAAIEATIQFGGHKAVPILQGLAARTWDEGEKKELLEAAEFLSLPTLTEIRAQNPNFKLNQAQGTATPDAAPEPAPEPPPAPDPQ